MSHPGGSILRPAGRHSCLTPPRLGCWPTYCRTLREHTLRVAERAEAELGKEQFSFIDGCPADWEKLPIPEGRIVVGLDGGYVRNWDDKKSNFEVIVGRSVPEDRDARYIGLAHGYDSKPKRRVFDVLKSQGLQANQDVNFLTDGGEEIRALTEFVTPASEHALDRFHTTMRVTVLQQYARGIAHHDAAVGARLLADLERIKWLLWNGNQHLARESIGFFEGDVDGLEVGYPNLGKFAKSAHEFAVHIKSNTSSLINYGERFRAGERISSCLAESTVNTVISKRTPADAVDETRRPPAAADPNTCARRDAPDRCSKDGIPGWQTTIHLPPLKPSQRNCPTNRHALFIARRVPEAVDFSAFDELL
jgi:hypothetical protein